MWRVLRSLSPEAVAWLLRSLRAVMLLRAVLARAVCEWQDWRDCKRRYCKHSDRKAPLRLAARFNLSPPAKHGLPVWPPTRSAGSPPAIRGTGGQFSGRRTEEIDGTAQVGRSACISHACRAASNALGNGPINPASYLFVCTFLNPFGSIPSFGQLIA